MLTVLINYGKVNIIKVIHCWFIILVKVIDAHQDTQVRVLAQGFRNGLAAVSYTHLDVYKRQSSVFSSMLTQWFRPEVNMPSSFVPWSCDIAVKLPDFPLCVVEERCV